MILAWILVFAQLPLSLLTDQLFPEKSEIVYTAGTTPDPEKALIRAVTEVAQLAGDFNTDSNYIASGLPKPLSMEEVDYLTDSPRNRNY